VADLLFTVEPGQRLLSASFPRVVELSDGDYKYPEYKYRMFFQTWEPDLGMGVGSAVSVDGLDFSKEDGLRFLASEVGMDTITNPSIVRIGDGSYRLYFSGGEGNPGGSVFSATSMDLYNVTVESGVRVGIGAPSVTGWAEHPGVLLEPDGSVTLFYFRREPPSMWTATSTDGLTFTSESDTGINGNDPDAMRLSDGNVRVYYGGFDISVGGMINSARSVVPTYSLTLETSSGGTTDPSPGTYTYDSVTSVTIRAIPDTGYTFTSWSGDASGTTNPLTITMDSDKSIKANFTSTKTESDDEGGGGGCSIATACYGTPMAEEVKSLGAFRNRYLVKSPMGRAFVNFYDIYSPYVADFIRDKEEFKTIVREFLKPFIWIISKIV
jgi:uncharacterized repeat protein (TIGR02543 family)